MACGIFSCGMRTLSCGMWDLVPWPEIEPGPPALGAWSLSHWTTREVPLIFVLLSLYLFSFLFCSLEFFYFLYFSLYRIYTYFVRFMLQFFCFWGTNVNDGVFLISNSTFLLLVYGKTIDLCVLVLHPINLVYCFLVSRVFCHFFQIFYIEDHVFCKQIQFYIFLPNLYIFYFLS